MEGEGGRPAFERDRVLQKCSAGGWVVSCLLMPPTHSLYSSAAADRSCCVWGGLLIYSRVRPQAQQREGREGGREAILGLG
jgi:hypothetical protein